MPDNVTQTEDGRGEVGTTMEPRKESLPIDSLFFLLVIAICARSGHSWSQASFILPSSLTSTAAARTKTTTTTKRCITCSGTALLAALPSAALQAEHLTYSPDGEVFPLQDVSYVLPRGSRVALVGKNGAGKSTLLHVLAGKYKSDGQIVTPRGTRVVLVEQEPPLFGNLTVEDALLGLDDHSPEAVASSNSPYSVVRRYRSALKHSDAQQLAKAASLMEDVEGSWRILTKAEEVATKLRVWHLRASTVKSLSGGERKRLALAAALTQEPDVLLLDEPTNFLSLAGVQWLSDYLREAKKLSILLVTHDRAFLDDVCDRILELDQGKLYETVGSYSDYLQAKEDRLALQDAELQATKAKYRVELDWMRRQPQARETKSKSRIDAFHKLQKATKPCPRDPCLHLDAGATRRLGGKIVSMRNCNLKFGDKVILKDFSYDFCKGDRICLSGGNGVGKSAFVRVLTGELAPDSGTIDVGETIVMGVYDQMGIQLENPDQSLLDFVIDRVREAGTDAVLSRDEARDLLKTFEFPRKRWSDRVSHLSGGERRRLQMLSVFSRRPNFLVMDEPSVDCDLDTLQALERFLQDFKGVLLIVSHDRVFADKVTDHIFIFEGDGEVRDFLGSLSEYASTLVDIENESLASSLHRDDSDQKKLFNREDKAKRNEVRNVIRKAKKDMNSLERDIDLLKDQSESFQREIESGTEKGWSVLAELTEKLNSVSAAIEEKELRWMELAEQVEEFEAEAM